MLVLTSGSIFALGLFGRWGASKSFFINKMMQQIEGFSRQTRAGAGGPSYCRRIVQIDFNAWHYNEADIWASLVHHIFDTLQEYFAERRQEQVFKNLIGRLEISQQQRGEIEAKLDQKQAVRDCVARVITEREEEIESNVQKQ